jgi:hypothetical protein
MKVKFKDSIEPCIQYEVIDPIHQWNYDELFDKYILCLEIESLGLVPQEILEETTHPDNINATDIAINLSLK